MKTINLLVASALVLFVAASCQKEPSSQDIDNEYLVYTAPSKDVDLSKYPVEDGAYYFLTDFAYDRTGYITIDGLLALVDEYNAIGVTWLPAPDDRSRFLTYVAPYASKKWD